MITLLKIEWKKISPNKTVWVLLILYFLLLGIVFTGVQSLIDNITGDLSKESPIKVPDFPIYVFPDIWHNLAYLAGFSKIILGLILIILVTNEFSFKTVRQNIASGISRPQFLYGKALVVITLGLLASAFLFLSGLILGLLHTSDINFGDIFTKAIYVLAYFWEVVIFLLFVMMLAFMVKKAGFAIGLLFLYMFVIEPILIYRLPDSLERIMPLCSVSNLIDVPNTALMKLVGFNFRDHIPWEDFTVSTIYGIIFIAITYYHFRRSDL